MLSCASVSLGVLLGVSLPPHWGGGSVGIRRVLQCPKLAVIFANKGISDFRYKELEPCRLFVCFKESKFNLWHCWKATRAGKALV